MKKSKKFTFVFSLLFIMSVLMSFFVSTASAASPSEAKNSVVVVQREDSNVYGTGFAIGEVGKPVEYIVTNNHVVNDVDNGIDYTTAEVWFSMASGEGMLANVYYSNAEKDIAILKLPEATDKRQAFTLCPMKYVDVDDTFAALGYPTNYLSDWPKFNFSDITVTKGGIKKIDRVNSNDAYILDLDITYGNSGGPLINSAGEVVGINTGGAIDVANLASDSYAIAIDELISVIDKDRIPLSIHGGSNSIYIIIGGVVLAIIVILIIAFALLRKGKNDEEEHSIPVISPQNTGAEAPVPKPVAPSNNKKAVRIIAIGGNLNGKKYSVTGSAVMGRDSSKCSIVFPVNTQGVSAVHCEITFDGTVCYLKDLNSSYGTFVIGSGKLSPNVPKIIKSGEKFYLASPENTFEVRF